MTSKNDPLYDAQDEEIFSQLELLNGKYIPPQPEFLAHLDNYVNGKSVTLQWKCAGHRPLTPERKDSNDGENGQFSPENSEVNNDFDEEFEFEEETNPLSFRRNATPQGKKTKTNSLQSILSHIERHRKIDMLGTKDEMENKFKQKQEHLLDTSSNLSETQNLNDDKNSDKVKNTEQEFNSNSIEPSKDQLSENAQNSRENSQQADTPKSGNATPAESRELKQVQQEVKQLQIFPNKLPQSSLNFQNILSKTLEKPKSTEPTNSTQEPGREDKNGVPTSQPSSSVPEKKSSEEMNMDFDSIGMNVKPMDFLPMKESSQSLEILGSDLPIPEESKQDLSEFDFQMDD